MEDKKEKEELQSRREFFKKAARNALPILGAIILASNPITLNAEELDDPLGCQWGCSSGCKGSCGRACSTGCTNSCAGSCSGACKGGCSGNCKGSCSFGCRGSSY